MLAWKGIDVASSDYGDSVDDVPIVGRAFVCIRKYVNGRGVS